MKIKLRIVKITQKNNKEYYIVQKRTRLFWLGPYIWETYQDVYDGYGASHTGWTWFITWGDHFQTLESAEKCIQELKDTEYGYRIIKTEVVETFKG